MAEIVLTDPTACPPLRPAWLARRALRLIQDPRDLVFVGLSLEITLVLVPLAAALFVPGWFRWWLAPPYLAVVYGVYVDRYILMLHNTSHRRMYKPEHDWLNGYVPRFLGLFFGETPDTYYAHHVGMHHVEGNLEGDLSTTMPYQRDSIVDFLRYFFRFFFLAIIELQLYFWRRNRRGLFLRALGGELVAYALYALLLWINWRATVVVFLIPLVVTRFLMMAGNWGQHAFVSPDDPGNDYVNSITCINTRYNRRAFNDGYHIGHHVKPTRHWTEMPGDFERNRAEYARQGALVFEGIDFFQVWALLMLHRYEALAARLVPLADQPLDRAQVVALLRERTRRFPEPVAARVAVG
jgi:fatty acid desaturase